jgi:hypothetical protein
MAAERKRKDISEKDFQVGKSDLIRILSGKLRGRCVHRG